MVLDGIKLEDDIVKKMMETQNKVSPYEYIWNSILMIKNI